MADIRPVGGMQAMWLISTLKGSGQILDLGPDVLVTEHLVGIPRENDLLIFALESRADRFQADSKDFEEMLKTLKVEGKQTKEQAEAK